VLVYVKVVDISRSTPVDAGSLASRNLLRILQPYPTNLIYLTCIST
jgi:hypothetical protein